MMIVKASDEDEGAVTAALFSLSYLTETNDEDILTYVGTNEQFIFTLVNFLTYDFHGV